MLKVCSTRRNVSSRHLWRVAIGNASSSLLGKNAPLERFLNPRLRVPFAKEKRQGKNPVFFFGALKVCSTRKSVSSRHLWRVAMGNASSSLLGKNAPLERFLNPRLRVPFAKEKRQGKNPVFFFGALKGTRTPDLLVRSQSLYPAELSARMRFFSNRFAILSYLFQKSK